jgi:hypothetical protein
VHYFAFSVLAAPLSILLHEAAHFVLAVAFGFPGVRFHYASVTYADEQRVWQLVWAGRPAAANAIRSLCEVGWMTMAGPLLNWMLCLALAAAVHVSRSRLAAVLGALLAGRAFLVGWFVIFRPEYSRNDEDFVGRVLEVSPAWIAGFGIAVSTAALAWMLRALRGERAAATLATAVGGMLGGWVYLVHLGPRVLP